MYSIALYVFLSLFYQCSYAAFVSETIIHTPYSFQRLGTIKRGQIIVSYDENLKKIDYGTIENISFVRLDHVYKVTCDDGTYFITTADQQCMLYGSRQWCKVKGLVSGDRLLCKNNRFVTVVAIEQIKENTQLCQIEVARHHTFFVTNRGILVHNNEVAVATGAVVTLATVAPPLIPIITVVKCVSLVGLFGVAVWRLLSKKKNSAIKQKYTHDVSPSMGSSSPPPPKKPDDEDEFKKRHPHGRYEDAPYHKNHQSGRKSPRPIDGQAALDNSIEINIRSGKRIGVSNKQIVELNYTSEGLYHGYVVEWSNLERGLQILLKNNNFVKTGGKFF